MNELNIILLNKEGYPIENDEELIHYNNPVEYIEMVSIPKKMSAGEEFVYTEIPTIRLRRTISRKEEVFTRPYFYYTDKIKIEFHWSSISVVGSMMEKPNKFHLPIPENKDEAAHWFLKMNADNDAKPGLKPIYISVDTYHKNIIYEYLFKLYRGLTILAIFATFVLVFASAFFNIEDVLELIGINVQNNLVHPIIILGLLLFAFWKNIDQSFSSLFGSKLIPNEENISSRGIKGISNSLGVTIEENNSATNN